MKKVLFVLYNLNAGGAERVTLDLLTRLDRKRFLPVLFLIKREGQLLVDVPQDVEVWTGVEAGDSVVKYFFHILMKIVRVAKKCDVIVGALELKTTYFAGLAGLLAKRPVIGWVHTDLQMYLKTSSMWHKITIPLFYPRLEAVVAVSNAVAKSVLSLVPSLKERVIAIYNPISAEEIRRKSNEEIDFVPERPIILSSGRLAVEKRFDLLIEAFAKIIIQGVDAHLVILGEGPERVPLEQLIRKLGLNDKVTLPGFQTNPFGWMKQASVFVSSSDFEGFSNVLVEAMSLGVPVIATKCAGPNEILEGGKYGLLVSPGDIDSLAIAIKGLLFDKEYARQLGNAGLKRVLDFAPEKIMPQIERVLWDSIHVRNL